MHALYQHLPSLIRSDIFTIGGFSLYWYSVMWMVAFAVCWGLLMFRVTHDRISYTKDMLQTTVFSALIGALIGGRIGYVLFYNFTYYAAHPLAIVSPYDFSAGQWTGIYGMSYHGGLIGVLCALCVIAYRYKTHILALCDTIVPVVPLGYFFGRVGNFLNHELVGRVTQSPWGMYFYDDNILRHPSQLYEAFCEGLVLFILLWTIRNRAYRKGVFSALYLIGYACARFCVEFFRQPDAQLGFVAYHWTMGQILSLVMGMCGILLLFFSVTKKE